MSRGGFVSSLLNRVPDSWQTDRRAPILAGSGVIVLFEFGSWLLLFGILLVQPRILYLTGIVKIAGWLAGGATVGYLRQRGGFDGAKYGFVTGLVGFVLSFIIFFIPRVVVFLETTAIVSSPAIVSHPLVDLLLLTLVQTVVRMLFLAVVGAVGGGLAGWALQRRDN